MGRFWDFLKAGSAPSPGKLPLIHSTDLFAFRQIRQDERLTPTKDDDNHSPYKGQALLYFFYGRPSYRANASKNSVSAKALLPVSFIISPIVADKAFRIVPFDSGAFANKAMHPPFHDGMAVEEFELTGAINAPMRIINTFYGTERHYYYSRPRPVVAGYNEYEDLEVDAYFRLLRHRPNNTIFDDRVTAIEIQLKEAVELKGTVKAVVLPEPYLDLPGVANQIERWGSIALPYRVQEEFVPREIHGAIWQRITDYLEQSQDEFFAGASP